MSDRTGDRHNIFNKFPHIKEGLTKRRILKVLVLQNVQNVMPVPESEFLNCYPHVYVIRKRLRYLGAAGNITFLYVTRYFRDAVPVGNVIPAWLSMS